MHRHSRIRVPEEHGGIWGTSLVEQMELETVGWVLEYPILPELLGHVVVLDEVSGRLARVLDLLIPVAKGCDYDGVVVLVDGVGTVRKAQQPGNALVRGG